MLVLLINSFFFSASLPFFFYSFSIRKLLLHTSSCLDPFISFVIIYLKPALINLTDWFRRIKCSFLDDPSFFRNQSSSGDPSMTDRLPRMVTSGTLQYNHTNNGRRDKNTIPVSSYHCPQLSQG